jgi:serine/threonine-protein kinase
MKFCPNCQTQYSDDANFCPQESCATPQGPRRLEPLAAAAPAQRYEMDDRLGGSRTGDVFRARDTQTGAAVVYKVAAPASLPTPAAFERSLRELKQLQRAQNAHLARVLDFGKDADGRLFIVTEFVDGQPLDRMVAAGGPMPLDRAKRLIAQIGEALLEGQKVGVVHHDLSPKNVLITASDDVKLINFVVPVPVSGNVLGVAEYLSPEQAEGKLVDQRSNTYSLGGILLFLLSGQPPFSGGDDAATLQQVLQSEIVAPSRRVEGLTPETDRVVLKAMDKSPNRRPLTMRQFLTDVTGLVAAGAAPAGAAAGGVGFAKTMLFSGGSPEVQKLVNQAVAARGNATAGFAPAAAAAPAAPVDPQATPPPIAAAQALGPRRTHGAAVAATVVALPAAKVPGPALNTAHGSAASPSVRGDSGPIAATPPPVAATPPPVAAAPAQPVGATPAPTPKPAQGGAFRETLWFKKGDVDQMVADARARVEAARAKGVAAPEPEPPVAPEEDAKPLDERYVDDGSVTAEDRKKFSLRSGGTSTALPTVGAGVVVPGDRMSDSEMVGQIGGGKRTFIIIGAVAVALAIGVTVYMLMRGGKGVEKSAEALAPAPIATQPAPPAAEPLPPSAPAAAAKAPAPVATKDAKKEPEAKDDEEEAAAPAPKAAAKPAAAKKHVAAKKTKGKKHRK